MSESLRFNKDDSKDIWTFRYKKGTNPFKDSANIVFPKGNTFGIQIKQSYKSSIVKWADIKFKSDSNINQYFEYSSDKESATYKVLVDGLSEHDWELIIEKDRDGNYSLSINFSVTDKQEQKKEEKVEEPVEEKIEEKVEEKPVKKVKEVIKEEVLNAIPDSSSLDSKPWKSLHGDALQRWMYDNLK